MASSPNDFSCWWDVKYKTNKFQKLFYNLGIGFFGLCGLNKPIRVLAKDVTRLCFVASDSFS